MNKIEVIKIDLQNFGVERNIKEKLEYSIKQNNDNGFKLISTELIKSHIINGHVHEDVIVLFFEKI